jgi:hypothetical protein
MKDNLLVLTEKEIEESRQLKKTITKLNEQKFFTLRVAAYAVNDGLPLEIDESGHTHGGALRGIIYDGRGIA